MPQNNPCVTNGLLPPDIYDTNLNTQLTYNIDFDFVAEEDVVVFREQPAGTFTLLTNSAATGATPPNYTINQGVSPAQVTFAAGEAPGGVSLIVGRRTDICDPVVEYQVGAAIRAGDLNASNTQLLHLIQELRSTLGFMINGNNTDPIVPGTGMDLNDLDDVNVGDPVNPDPALLRFNGTEWVGNTVLEDGDTWVSNDTTFATTAAGDDRWLGGGATPDVVGGPGVTITPNQPAAGQILVSADLEAAGAGEGGLVFDPAGNTGEIRVNVGNGLELTDDGVEVDLAATPGLQFVGGDLQAIGNSVTENAGDVRLTNGPSNVVVNAGANVTVTRDSATQFTIAASGGTGLTYRGTVNPTTTGVTSALPDGQAGDILAVDTTGTIETSPIDWGTAINGAATTVNTGDLLQCVTPGDGTPANTRYTLIETGTPAPNLQAVTAAGNTTTNNILLQTGTTTQTFLNANGSAVFNDQGSAVDFRVESDTNSNMLFVDGSENRVGIGTNVPSQALDVNGTAWVRGNVRLTTGNSLELQNTAGNQQVSLNADDATATYNITLPPAIPGAGTRYLRAAGTGVTANQELEWASGGGGATGGSTATTQDYIFQENGQAVRNDYTVGTTLAAQPGSGVTTGTCNALSAGPVTINNGVTVTIENGSNWVVI